MDDAVQAYLDELVRRAADVLGDLAAAYAAGSVALGAYQPGRSDVDVALVCAGTVDSARKRELVARLRHAALPCPARGLELVVYTAAAAASGTPEPAFELELNDGARMPFRTTCAPGDRPAADGLFWYGLDRSILHQAGLALLGPPAAEAFADLAPADLRRLLVEALRWWLALPAPDGPAPGTEDAVLSACRSLVKIRYGSWLAKEDAGRRLLPDPLVERAIAARHGGPPPAGTEARAFQRRVLAEIAG